MRSIIVKEDMEYILKADLPWTRLAGKNVLITGANGFLPAYLVELCMYLNDYRSFNINVFALVRSQEKAVKKFPDYLNRHDFHLIVQDVCDKIEIEGALDFIIHAASQASPKYYGSDPVGTSLPNIIATKNLLQVAKEKKSEKFLFFSSGEVYGEISESKIPTEENSFGYVNPTELRSCYAESKRMGESLCISYFHQFAVPSVIVRPFHTYGPGMSLDDGRVFSDFVSDVVNNKDIIMKSDGSARRAFCYLADAIAGFFTILFCGQNGQAYNIGNEQGEVSILELAQILVDLFPDKNLKVIRRNNEESDGYLKSKISRNCPSIKKAESLGWYPKYSVESGFKRTIEFYYESTS